MYFFRPVCIFPVPVRFTPGGHVRTHRYRITVNGALGGAGREAFADFVIEVIEAGGARTVLFGDLDDSGLHGTLNRVQMLGLELLELVRVPDGVS